MKTEAAVIGGGPAGLLAAEAISSHGFDVTVFEEHQRIGYPVHCAGMVSVEGMKRLGVKPDSSFLQNTVYGGSVFSGDGTCITIRDRKPRAYIIDRGQFDGYLAERAVKCGVDIRTGTRVDRLLFKRKTASGLVFDGDEVGSKVVIDAEGVGGRILQRSGISHKMEGVLKGFNAELTVEGVDPELVEVWFSQETAKDFFTWVIPLGEERVRCGLATSREDGLEHLKEFIEKRFGIKAPKTVQSGLVCSGGPVGRTVFPGLILVGDVAGQVKPTTGGGVVIGGLCAGIAAEVAVRALDEGVEAHSLDQYEEEWRSRYGSELQTMLFMRRLANTLDDERMNRMFHAFKEEGIEGSFTRLVENGDMDMQADVIKRALTDPAILGALVKSLGRLAVSELSAVLGF